MRSLIPAWMLALSVVLAGCKDSRPAPEPHSAAPQLSVESLTACSELERTLESIPVDRRVANIASRCGPLFLEPGCRSAWQDAAALPADQRVGRLMEGCRAAYCPLLSPAPNLCRATLQGLPVDVLVELWMPFVLAALAHDHGLEASLAHGHVPSIAPALLSTVDAP